ncbi:hypothetical protein D9M69_620520 [compost metagenome]
MLRASRSGTVAIISLDCRMWPMATKCGTLSRMRRWMPCAAITSSALPWPVPAACTCTWSAALKSFSDTLRLRASGCVPANRHT